MLLPQARTDELLLIGHVFSRVLGRRVKKESETSFDAFSLEMSWFNSRDCVEHRSRFRVFVWFFWVGFSAMIIPIASAFMRQSLFSLLIAIMDFFCLVNSLISGTILFCIPPMLLPPMVGKDTLRTFTLLLLPISNDSFEFTTRSISLCTRSALKSSADEKGIWMG